MLELTTKQKKLLDELLKNFDGDVQALLGHEGLLGTISKHVIETALGGGADTHPKALTISRR